MTDCPRNEAASMDMHAHSPGVVLRSLVIGLTAFLTVVDLFATQAILPSLTRHYNVTPAAMGFAVNASTLGMAVAGLVVGFFSPHIDRRLGILFSLVLLAIPTALLASAPDLTVFTILRVLQGLCMASAFTLTLAYLGEQCSSMDAGGAFAAYITGNVASNLIGRLISAAVADSFGLASNFYFFAAAQSRRRGAGLFHDRARQADARDAGDAIAARGHVAHLRNPPLRAAFGIGFCILFAFIGTFTYVNFVLVARRCRSAGWTSASSISCSCLRSSRRCSPARRSRASARGRRSGARSRSPPSACRCCCCASAAGSGRHGAGRRRHLLRAGRRDRLCRPGGGDTRRRQRHLSRLLFLRRPGRQRRARSALRPLGWTACVAGIGASLAIAALLTARLALKPSAASPA